MHLWAHIADVALYLPDAFARSSFVSEETNVACVGLRIVGTYQTQECALASSVSSAHGPSLAFANRPVEVGEYGARTISDADIVELQYLAALFGIECRLAQVLLRQGEQPLPFFLGQGGRVWCLLLCHELLPRHLLSHFQVFDGNDVGDELRQVVALRHHQYQRQSCLCQLCQQNGEFVACGSIESDKRVVHDEDARMRSQHTCQL